MCYGTTVTDGVLHSELEPMSWNMIRMTNQRD
jgi:alpha-N-arabinofuranosidase